MKIYFKVVFKTKQIYKYTNSNLKKLNSIVTDITASIKVNI